MLAAPVYAKRLSILGLSERSAAAFFMIPEVHSLLREYTGVLEGKRLEIKSKSLACRLKIIVYAPLLRESVELPLTAALCGPVIMTVIFLPSRILFVRIPYHLGIGSYQGILSPSLKFFATTAVKHGVFFPVFCDPHKITKLPLTELYYEGYLLRILIVCRIDACAKFGAELRCDGKAYSKTALL